MCWYLKLYHIRKKFSVHSHTLSTFFRYDYSGYGQSSGKVCFFVLLNNILKLWIDISLFTNYSWGFMNCVELVGGKNTSFIWSHVPVLQPSEQNTYADIEAAYKCLEESYGTKQEDIILYGQSVGSGPTLDLAARLPQLRAVVLHSPILSGLRVMYPV